MKKTFYPSLLALTCIATLLLAGCQKDSTTLRLYAANFGGNGKVYMVDRLPHWAENDAVWCDDADDDNHLATVSEVSSDGTATISVLSVNDGYRLIYPYNIVTSVDGFQATLEIPSVQRYYEYEVDGKQVVNAPMAAFTSNGSSVHFHNLGALIAINICNNTQYPNLIIDKVIVSSASRNLPLWGTATVADISSDAPTYHCQASTAPGVDPYTVSLIKYDADDNPIPIHTFTSNTGNDSYKKVYVYVPDHGSVDNRYAITIVARSSSTVSVNSPDCSRTQIQQSPRGGNLERNKMASITYEMFEVHAPTGAIDAKFTINSNGDQVYFAAGNLQYQRSTGIWRIAPSQCDYVGNGTTSFQHLTSGNYSGTNNNLSVSDNNNLSVSDNAYQGWIDLFGWATSGYQNDDDDYDIHFWPHHCTNDYTGSGNNFYGYGPSINMQNNTTLNGTPNANYDWGVYHSNLSVVTESEEYFTEGDTGGIYYVYVDANNNRQLKKAGPGSIWRTLTAEEWDWLLRKRVNGEETPSSYTGENELWSGVKCEGVSGILIYPDGYNGEIYSFSDSDPLPSVPEHCVFLPIAGQRSYSSNATTMSSTAYGYYWTTTGIVTSRAQNAKCLYLNVNSTAAVATSSSNSSVSPRYRGNSVRLVTPVLGQH